MRRLSQVIVLFFVPLFASFGFASSSGPAFADGVNYIDIKPPLIVNYGGAGKMRYIKAEISIRTEDIEGAMKITHHLPLIRDKLISILSQQTEEGIATAEGKEKLRVFALAEVNKVLHSVEKIQAEEKKPADKKKSKKAKDKKSDKKSTKDKKSKDKKGKSKNVEKDKKEKSGPASDLFFNNFVVQK